MPTNYERLRAMFEEHTETMPKSDANRQQILEAITEDRIGAFVSDAEQVRSLAALGYGRAAVAEAMNLSPDAVDELAAEAIDRMRAMLQGEG